jgi:hypothetical protein
MSLGGWVLSILAIGLIVGWLLMIFYQMAVVLHILNGEQYKDIEEFKMELGTLLMVTFLGWAWPLTLLISIIEEKIKSKFRQDE